MEAVPFLSSRRFAWEPPRGTWNSARRGKLGGSTPQSLGTRYGSDFLTPDSVLCRSRTNHNGEKQREETEPDRRWTIWTTACRGCPAIGARSYVSLFPGRLQRCCSGQAAKRPGSQGEGPLGLSWYQPIRPPPDTSRNPLIVTVPKKVFAVCCDSWPPRRPPVWESRSAEEEPLTARLAQVTAGRSDYSVSC